MGWRETLSTTLPCREAEAVAGGVVVCVLAESAARRKASRQEAFRNAEQPVEDGAEDAAVLSTGRFEERRAGEKKPAKCVLRHIVSRCR
jgi:hypothetical protein